MVRILIVTVLAWVALANWLLKEDRACNPTGKNGLLTYTGFRIQRQYTYGLPMMHHIRLTHCDSGSIDMEAVIAADRNTDITWGVNMCVDSNLCYRAVRSKQYRLRTISLYLPYSTVGGLFICPRKEICDNSNAIPVLPLLADRTSHQWVEFSKLTRPVQKIPYLYTPNILDPRYPRRHDRGYEWARHLDVNENYTYSSSEKLMLSRATTTMLNKVHEFFSLNSHLLPWEFDLVELDLALDQGINIGPLIDRVLQYLPSANRSRFLTSLNLPFENINLQEDVFPHRNA
uniref:ARAD1D44506p n=1 Tax=Blastobotrys adeninivorans TaxID=409370 RepID=A0A060TCP4_BLAAD